MGQGRNIGCGAAWLSPMTFIRDSTIHPVKRIGVHNSEEQIMIQLWRVGIALGLTVVCGCAVSFADPTDIVRTANGRVKGVRSRDGKVLSFKGIPFAAPPLKDLRWKDPQPGASWDGLLHANRFGPPCLQKDVFGDLHFRDGEKPSENCLSLNIWIPTKHVSANLPVIVWFYGGGLVTGGSSEPRYDGEQLARKGVIVVTANYRLGVFGFLALPKLTNESQHKTSGNYGLMDQMSALHWVIRNIDAFGGDPKNVTAAGQSAGSFFVSLLMASPLSQNLFQKAIGESGGFYPPQSSLREAEQVGLKFVESLNADSLEQLRSKPSVDLLEAASKFKGGFGFEPNNDGYVLPSDAATLYQEGLQSHIPLLAGWNADEGKILVLSAQQNATPKKFAEMAHARFGDQAAEFLKLYPAETEQEAFLSAVALAADDFSGFSTWKWVDMQGRAGAAVYLYHFEQVPPARPSGQSGGPSEAKLGSPHSAEIEYVFQTLRSRSEVPWTAADYKLSELICSYWTNFAKSGNPNAAGLPDWPTYTVADGFQVMHLRGTNPHSTVDVLRKRYLFLDAQSAKLK
jgi:para-nitrobenzyl esterase